MLSCRPAQRGAPEGFRTRRESLVERLDLTPECQDLVASERDLRRHVRGCCSGLGSRVTGVERTLRRMSEQGWREFLAAEGVDDWVVLHGGATAVFRVGSVGEAARLADAIGAGPGPRGSGALLTIADARLTVRLTRDLWRLEPRHVELARAVSAVARDARRGRGPRSRAGGAARDRREARCDRRRLLARRARATRRWPTTTPSTRSGTARRSGCRSSTRPSRCGTRCTSTCRSRASTSRRGWPRRLLPAAASSTIRGPGHWILADRAGNKRVHRRVARRGHQGAFRRSRVACASLPGSCTDPH